MKVLIIGAAGMIGKKLSARIIADGGIGENEVTTLILNDIFEPGVPESATFKNQSIVSDFSKPPEIKKLLKQRPDVIFHLAGVLSGECETNFDKGYQINLDGTRNLFDEIRNIGDSYKPRLVYTSSCGIYGAPFPDFIQDDFIIAPLTSYGTQKTICELLLSDYTRKGIFDGVGIRLPTICVRPGKPNSAASGFFSSIIREPLVGQEALLPVEDDVRHFFASPRSAVNFLLRAATIETEMIGTRRSISMPSVSASIGEEIAALRKFAGDSAVKLIKREANPAIAKIIHGWPKAFEAKRALALGFRADNSFEEIVKVHIEDEGIKLP